MLKLKTESKKVIKMSEGERPEPKNLNEAVEMAQQFDNMRAPDDDTAGTPEHNMSVDAFEERLAAERVVGEKSQDQGTTVSLQANGKTKIGELTERYGHPGALDHLDGA